MTKLTGLNSELYFDGHDLSGCISAVDTISSPRTSLEVTGLNKSSTERLYGLTDGCITMTSWFNPCVEHCAFNCLPTADVDVMVLLGGGAVGNVAGMMVGKQINYDGTRGADGSLSFNIQAQANNTPLEWGTVLVTNTTICSAGNSPSVNNCAASCNGVMAMLHVPAFCGCNLCVALQESSDDGCVDCFATIACFTQVTGLTSERVTTCGAVEQYLRLNYSGTFSSATVVAGHRRGIACQLVSY